MIGTWLLMAEVEFPARRRKTLPDVDFDVVRIHAVIESDEQRTAGLSIQILQ